MRQGVVINGIPDVTGIIALPFFSQMDVTEEIIIPEQKPDVEQINSVNLTLCLEDAWISGVDVFGKGVIKQKITYTACVPEQSVHTVESEEPFSFFIPVGVDIGVVDVIDLITLAPQDAFVQKVNGRKLFKNVLVVAAVDLPVV